MAFGTFSALPHGLGSTVSFCFVGKLFNDKVILIEDDATRIWEMADDQTAAVLIHTAAFNLKKGAAAREWIGGLDRVVACGDESFVFIQYDGGGSPTISEHSLSAGHSGQTLTDLCVAGGTAEFFAVGTGLAATYIQPQNPTGVTIAAWANGVTMVDTQLELPGVPVPINVWPLQSSIAEYDACNFASWVFSSPWMTVDDTLKVAEGAECTCFASCKPGKTIAGFTGAWVVTTDGGAQQPFDDDVSAVFFSDLVSLYLVAENPPDTGEQIELWYSSDGSTWNKGSASNLPFEVPDNRQVNGRGRGFFASLVTNNVYIFRTTDLEAASPGLRWWKSSDGINWSDQGAEANRVLGCYSNGGAGLGSEGLSEIIKLDTTNGDIYYSLDEGATAFSGPVSDLISAENAAKIRWIQETPTGLIAWGPEGPILTQDGTDLHSTAWVDEQWPGGEIGAHLRVTDAGVIVVHKRYESDIDTKEHWETWQKSSGTWSRKSLPQYKNCQSLGFEFLSLAGITGSLGEGMLIASSGDYSFLGFFTSHLAQSNCSWVSDIDPFKALTTRGPKHMKVLFSNLNDGRVKFNRQLSSGWSTASSVARQTGWEESWEQLRDNFGAIKFPEAVFSDQDIIVAIAEGHVIVSENGYEWNWVANQSVFGGSAQVT